MLRKRAVRCGEVQRWDPSQTGVFEPGQRPTRRLARMLAFIDKLPRRALRTL